MTLEEIRLELELAGVDHEQVNKLVRSCKNYGFDAATMDKKLMTMGYAKVFTIYDDEEVERFKKRDS